LAKRVFVTGLGIITSIGDNLAENLQSLRSGRSGIGEIRLLDTIHKGELPAGEIRHTDEELAGMAGIKFVEGISRTSLLGMIAAGEATADRRPPTGLISGCTVGGMGATEKYYLDYLSNDTRNAWIDSNGCSDSTEQIARYLGISGYISTINTACSSSANAIMMAVRLIRAGILDRAVAGGTDALSIFTLNGFNTLMIYDKEPCKPFDERRMGMNLGEGAAYLMLEGEESLDGREPLCEITGYGNSTDAYHQTALSPEGIGAYQAMKEALDRSGLSPEDIGYINAHGTATINNDLSEGIAIQRLFGESIPPVSSTKAHTGHMLGAAGAAEAVYSILSLMHNTPWPNLNFQEKMKELSFSPGPQVPLSGGIQHVLSNSFGFGGNNTSLIFSKIAK
jgi:3-oxoacyl-(acyl-carrier-protein) synthase